MGRAELQIVPSGTAIEGVVIGKGVPTTPSVLEDAERQLAEAIAAVDHASWRAAFILWSIYETEAWRNGHDDDGEPFTDFEVYVKSLRQRIPRMGVRWAQENIAMIALYTQVLGVSREELARCSPSSLREIKKLVAYDHRARAVKDFKVAGGKDAVLDLVKDAATPGTRPLDIRKRVAGALGATPITYYWDGHAPYSGNPHHFVVTAWHDDLPYEIHLSFINVSDVPDRIIADLRHRLGCPEG